MDLTPINIPGKRRRKGEPTTTSSPVPTKKAKKQPQTQPKNQPKKQPKKRQKKQPEEHPMKFEHLFPLEIWEKIFWYSENVNLPRCSPRIGRFLSGKPTLRQTFINAFAPTWDVWFGCIINPMRNNKLHTFQGIRDNHHHTVQSYHGWKEDSDRFGGNPHFQSALLEFRWADIHLILDCWENWAQRHAKNRPFEHIKIWDLKPTPYDIGPVGNTQFEKPFVLPADPTSPVIGIEKGFKGKDFFFNDWHSFRTLNALRHKDDEDTECKVYRVPSMTATWMEVHKDTRIPDNLLTGPWDEDAILKLFWLVRAGARLSTDQTWELTLQGYHQVSGEHVQSGTHNYKSAVVRLLDQLQAFAEWPSIVITREYGKAFQKCDNPPLGSDVVVREYLQKVMDTNLMVHRSAPRQMR